MASFLKHVQRVPCRGGKQSNGLLLSLSFYQTLYIFPLSLFYFPFLILSAQRGPCKGSKRLINLLLSLLTKHYRYIFLLSLFFFPFLICLHKEFPAKAANNRSKRSWCGHALRAFAIIAFIIITIIISIANII